MDSLVTSNSVSNKIEPDYYYDILECRETIPDKVRSDEHTMKKLLWYYLGRANPETGERLKNDDILSKKFSEIQKLYLKIAFRRRIIVRVMGVEKTHYLQLLKAHSRVLVKDPGYELATHVRNGKAFNKQRAWMMWTELAQDLNSDQKSRLKSSSIELWVLVFPSAQYVDQVAELIQAIYDDFEKIKLPGKGIVSVWHFNKLENEVGKWTLLESSITSYIRHGEVVVIGNVELLLNGIISVGYQKKFADWQRFGLNNMFGIQILVSQNNSKRIVLLGVDECFWGEASAFYVETLLKAGARHILYGSKAASMSKVTDIHTIKSPSHFNVYSKHTTNQWLTKLSSTLGTNESLGLLALIAGIDIAGINATVPTVIGEDETQRLKLADLTPSTMDNEDGYIARIVHRHNKLFGLLEQASFLPVHFISDYIHKPGENPEKGQSHLGSTQIEERNIVFTKIGQFFGIYTFIYGLEEYVTIQTQLARNAYYKSSVEGNLKQIRELVYQGMITQAIESISNLNQPIPISNLLSIALLCQKYGYTDDALKAIDAIKNDSYWEKLGFADKLLVSIIDLRILTQTGNYLQAEEKINIIWQKFGDSKNFMLHEHYNSLLRRRALILAQNNSSLRTESDRKKNWEEVKRWFNKSKSFTHRGTDANHENATCELYYFTAALATDVADTHNYRERLSKVRSLYLMAPKQPGPWMTNPEKSAANALFVEAAHHLLNFGYNDTCGLIRLGIAHLWNTRVGGTERSEGYGELISFITDETLKDLFRRAMRIDNQGKREFQMWLQSQGIWTKIQKFFEIFVFPIEERAGQLDKILQEMDRKWRAER